MLRQTFIHARGVGPTTERRLWIGGVHSWEVFLERISSGGLPDRRLSGIVPVVRESEKALAAAGVLVADSPALIGETLVQAVALDRPPALPEHDDVVAVEAPDTPAFVDAVGGLRDSTPAQREAHRERLMNSPLGKRYAVIRVRERVVCTAQIAVEGQLAGLFDVITAPDARRQGFATLACASLLSWAWQHGAQGAYLQVSADNALAIDSYRRFGFATIYTYHYRGQPGKCE